MKKVIYLFIFITLLVFNMAAQNRSFYTSTRAKTCRTIRSDTRDAGSYEGECKGVGGYKVRLLEGDIRQTLTIVTPEKKKHELNFWGYYGGFSSVGERIEWRMKKGVPVALIARFNVANAEDSSKTTSYLIVSKIGKKESCVTDIVAAGNGQNQRARELADAASKKPCKAE